MQLYTVYDMGNKVADGVGLWRVTEITGVSGSNIAEYARKSHIKSGRYQICYANEYIVPKDLSKYKNKAFTPFTAHEWDKTVAMFKQVRWGNNGKKLKVHRASVK